MSLSILRDAARLALMTSFAVAALATSALAADVKGYLGDVDVARKLITVDGEPYSVPGNASIQNDNGRYISLSDLSRLSVELLNEEEDLDISCKMTTRRSPTGGPDQVISLEIDIEEF